MTSPPTESNPSHWEQSLCLNTTHFSSTLVQCSSTWSCTRWGAWRRVEIRPEWEETRPSLTCLDETRRVICVQFPMTLEMWVTAGNSFSARINHALHVPLVSCLYAVPAGTRAAGVRMNVCNTSSQVPLRWLPLIKKDEESPTVRAKTFAFPISELSCGPSLQLRTDTSSGTFAVGRLRALDSTLKPTSRVTLTNSACFFLQSASVPAWRHISTKFLSTSIRQKAPSPLCCNLSDCDWSAELMLFFRHTQLKS